MLWSETTLLWLWEQKFQGMKVPGSESTCERKFHNSERTYLVTSVVSVNDLRCIT